MSSEECDLLLYGLNAGKNAGSHYVDITEVDHDFHKLIFFGLGLICRGEVLDSEADAVNELADVLDLLVEIFENEITLF